LTIQRSGSCKLNLIIRERQLDPNARIVTTGTVMAGTSGYQCLILTWEHIMKRNRKPFVSIRKNDCKSVFDSIYLRETVFRKAVTAADVKAGLLPRRNG
jgi:hypothetical protein